jgi:hypothetical protein
MRSWKKAVIVCVLAFTLPVQTFAAALGHCGSANLNLHLSAATPMTAAGQPCAHHTQSQDGAPAQPSDHPFAHAGACAACCAVPTALTGFTAAAVSAATSFPLVIDRNPQFVPSGLKRPPSAV